MLKLVQMPTGFLVNVLIGGFVWWLAIYLLSKNLRSRLALISSLFLASLSVFLLAVEISKYLTTYDYYNVTWHSVEWSYLLPIALIFHFSVIVTRSTNKRLNQILLIIIYMAVAVLFFLTNRTNLMIDYDTYKYIHGTGYVNPRGPIFWLLVPAIALSTIGAAANYYTALSKAGDIHNRRKFSLALLSSLVYLVVGVVVVYLYYDPSQITAVRLAPSLLIVPFIPMLVAIFFYRLITDVDYIFNWKEFIYLSITIFLINILSALIFLTMIAPRLGEFALILLPLFMLITITTHSFYDWLTTFIRDLIYNSGKGFSLITDSDVSNLIKDFHVPEKLEVNPLTKFKMTKQAANNGKLVDAAQAIVREAIEYFKQSDYPRRTKQNLKYQMLKMLALDSAEEGQILWELGFDGYPMKILAGENQTRKPLFKIESMSDYTATSRNAFIALKKEAIHDLAWRLSYLERHSN